MSMNVDLGPKTRIADGAIAEFSIVEFTANNGVAQSTTRANAGEQHGVVQEIQGVAVGGSGFGSPAAAGDHVDVYFTGVVRVTLGATVAAGVLCGADAQGRAVAAATGEHGIVTLLEGGNINEIVYAYINDRAFD